jgi:hypothetical protein
MERLTKRHEESGMVWFVDHENIFNGEKRELLLEPCEMSYHHYRLAIQKLAEYEEKDAEYPVSEKRIKPLFNVDAVKEQVREEIRNIMDTYVGSMPDDIFSELETLEQEKIGEIFNACGSYGMRD